MKRNEKLRGHFGDSKSENCEQLVANLIRTCKMLGCWMSLKLYFLHTHLNFLSGTMGNISEEHGK